MQYQAFYTKILFFLAVILTCYIPNSAYTADMENNMQFARWYKIYWKQLHIADLRVGINNGKIVANIDSYGVVQKISKYKNYSNGSYIINDGNYIPQHFELSMRQRQGIRKINIEYDQNGVIIKESVNPPDKRYKRPAVLNESKQNALDPLNAILLTKNKIEHALKNKTDKFDIKLYDGRRLSRLDFKIYGRENINIGEKSYNVLKIGFKEFPLEGYTQNELKRMEGENPDFILYLEKDTLIPLQADASAPLGRANFVLEKECTYIEECV